MKVILFPSTTAPVGVSTHVLNLARLLAKADVLETVLCPSTGWLVDQLSKEGLSVEVLPLSYRPWGYWHASLKLRRFLNSRSDSCIIHLHGRFPLFLAVPLTSALRGHRFVTTVHQFPDAASDGPLRWKFHLETLLLRRLPSVICVSQALESHLATRLGEAFRGQLVTISNWIQPSVNQVPSFRRKAGQPLRICAVGRLAEVKGFDILIEAIMRMHRAGHPIQCDIFGDGPQFSALQWQIDRDCLNSVVSLRGSAENVRALMPDYDVLAIPSREESFGLVALEAFDAGIPVVASDVPGLNEVVRHQESGLLFRAGDPEALSAALKDIAASEALSRQLVEGGSDRLVHFTPTPQLLTRYLELYTS
jgi:glycosyltransferase involved in cell wall biosynthesis